MTYQVFFFAETATFFYSLAQGLGKDSDLLSVEQGQAVLRVRDNVRLVLNRILTALGCFLRRCPCDIDTLHGQVVHGRAGTQSLPWKQGNAQRKIV